MTDANNGKQFLEWNPTFDAEGEAKVAAYQQEFVKGGELFRQVRDMLGMTQNQVAMLLQTTQANVSKAEKRASLDVDQLRSLAAQKEFDVVVVLRSKDKEVEFAL